MADASVEDLTINVWTSVATATTICNLFRKKLGFDYYYTTRDTGGSAPSAPTGTIVPAEAVKLFRHDDQDIIVMAESSDIYLSCFVNDSNIAGTGDGQVRVDS